MRLKWTLVSSYRNKDRGSHFMASWTSSANERQMTKTSCTPARARLSSVQSSRGALQIGSKHYSKSIQIEHYIQVKLQEVAHPWSTSSERLESLVEAICQNHGLQNFILFLDEFFLPRGVFRRHRVYTSVNKSRAKCNCSTSMSPSSARVF